MSETNQYIDVLIMGAGLSGIGSAYHLQKHCSDKTYIVLEARNAIGGTWDLFRYPGIRSDSDMFTFGYKFKPWKKSKTIANGDEIKHYIEEAASENRIDQHIRFDHKIISADWSDKTALWTVTAQSSKKTELQVFNCKFFFSCGGYYNHDNGHVPKFEGVEQYQGKLIHPQQWPQDLDYSHKKIVVIGSGATAITLIPSLAKNAAMVTMLQRSPSYIYKMPLEDKVAKLLYRWLPTHMAYSIVRTKNIAFNIFSFSLAKRRPDLVKRRLFKDLRKSLGPDFDIDTHFKPTYEPWDQRLCVAPDGDLLDTIRSGKARVVTDHIDHFTETGITLKSGNTLDADIVVTATGLELVLFKGLQLTINGKPIDISDSYSYKGMMLSGVPNFAFSVGYTNASWTLKSDLVGEYVCRVLNYMDRNNKHVCVPIKPDECGDEMPIIDFKSSYVLRALSQLPKQGSKKPWRLYQNYLLDRTALGFGSVKDQHIKFR